MEEVAALSPKADEHNFTVTGLHVSVDSVLLNDVPTSQATQLESTVDEPATYPEPGGQLAFVCGAHAIVLAVAWKEPAAHGWHREFDDGVPAVNPCPALHPKGGMLWVTLVLLSVFPVNSPVCLSPFSAIHVVPSVEISSVYSVTHWLQSARPCVVMNAIWSACTGGIAT